MLPRRQTKVAGQPRQSLRPPPQGLVRGAIDLESRPALFCRMDTGPGAAPLELRRRENLERFCRLVAEDPVFHRTLREAPNLESFIERTVRLGESRGCDFTAEDVRLAVQEKRREWLQHWL
jgi:hypothetical protein